MNDDDAPTSGRSSDPVSGSGASGSGASAGDTSASGEPAAENASSSESGGSADADTQRTRSRSRRGFVRRHWILLSLAVVLVLIGGSAGGYLYWVNNQLSSIKRIHIPTFDTHPQPGGSTEKARALNILLLGADNGIQQQSVAADLLDNKWTPFAHRSDTLMIAHIPADRESVQLVSIPRDTWVPIDGYPSADGHAKLNAAFAYGGPDLAVKTVEQLTGITIDHLAVIDWAGFKDLTTALGGVRVYIPHTFYDDSQRLTWPKGWHTYSGQQALAYVRTRHGLANGDFGRIARQQNFMRATMGKMLTQTHKIISMTKIIKVVTKFLTIDSQWDNSEIIDLALSLRNIKSADVQFLTAPLGRYDTTPDGQSIVRLAAKKSQELFSDVKHDEVNRYLQHYPHAALSGNKSVN